jgi:hypothetical protein
MTNESAPSPAPVQPEAADANTCRIELVTALHGLVSQVENSLYAFGADVEARRQAEGAAEHARNVAARWNWNGPWDARPEDGGDVEKLREALTDMLWSAEANPSCQAGMVPRCKCRGCCIKRARAALAS